MTAVDSFYEASNILLDLATNQVTEAHKAAYEAILLTTQTETTEALIPLKIMTSATIVKYIDHFELHDQALNSLFDLCEDYYLPVRLESIKNLFSFAVKLPKYTTRIIDVLLQLLQSNEERELKLVKELLIAMFKKYPKDCCSGLFHQVENGTCQAVLFSFVDEELMEHLSPALKVKFFKKFLSLLDTSALENCSKVMIDLMPELEDQETVGKILNLRLQELFKSPDENTVSNILAMSNVLKKSKQQSDLERLFALFEMNLLNTPVQQLNIMKLIAEMYAGINERIAEKFVQLIESKLSNEFLPLVIEAQNGKLNFGLPSIEPALFIIYKSKKLSDSKQNSELLTATLKSLYQPVIQLRDQLSKAATDVKYKILYATAKNAYTLIVELLKENRMQDYIDFKFSWLQVKPVPSKQQPKLTISKPKQKKIQKTDTKQKQPVKIQSAGRVSKKKNVLADSAKRLLGK
ncbi:Apoptosis inhibitor 5 [Boothiomyces sp. JEL0838]|nr:Apoptosis inhibitor 5 [Boothiomyces sp. JEL0838]